MNRYLNQFSGALEPGRVQLFAEVAIGATGAPTLTAAKSRGIASITRNSAGVYTVVLQDVYNRMFHARVTFKVSGGLPAAPVVGIDSETVASTKTLKFVCSTGGVATDPASGETMLIKIDLKNSSA